MDATAPPRRRLLIAAAVTAAGGLVACAPGRLDDARSLARQSTPLQQSPRDPARRLLIVGDSTGVGTGASTPQASVAGLLARDHPRLAIVNQAQDGATFAGTAAQLAASGAGFDLVLVMAGGNDVIRLRSPEALRTDVERCVALAGGRGAWVVLIPAGNVGNAAFFAPPLSWELTRRARALHAVVRDVAARSGAGYVDLFRERDDDPFVREPALTASDGLHPSDAGYRLWYEALMALPGVAERLEAARIAGG